MALEPKENEVNYPFPGTTVKCPKCSRGTFVPGWDFEFTGRVHAPFIAKRVCKSKTCSHEFTVNVVPYT